jgi:hypothetical protein
MQKAHLSSQFHTTIFPPTKFCATDPVAGAVLSVKKKKFGAECGTKYELKSSMELNMEAYIELSMALRMELRMHWSRKSSLRRAGYRVGGSI